MSKGMNKNTTIETVKLVRGIGSQIDWNTKENNQFVEAILALKTADEAKRFLRDLMTESEIKEFANRLEAAFLLSKNVQYDAITEDTGLSSKTVARIAKWLNGSLGGYRLILARLPQTTFKNSSRHHTLPKLRKGLSLT